MLCGRRYRIRWTRTCSEPARRTRKEHQIWMPMSWLIDARVHKHAKLIVKSNCVRCRGWRVCVSVGERKKSRKNPFCIYATLNFSVFDYHTDAMHCITFCSFFRWLWPIRTHEHIFSACTIARSLAGSVLPLFSHQNMMCDSRSLRLRLTILFSYINIFSMRKRKEIKASASGYAPEAHGIGIVDIHLIFDTRWIFHSISFHFMSFNIIMWCWWLCVRLDSILMNSLSCSVLTTAVR